MTTTYRFSYLPCESCVGKNHCKKCQEDIAGQLRALPGVLEAAVDRREGALTVTHDGADLDALEDAMDAAGVFLS